MIRRFIKPPANILSAEIEKAEIADVLLCELGAQLRAIEIEYNTALNAWLSAPDSLLINPTPERARLDAIWDKKREIKRKIDARKQHLQMTIIRHLKSTLPLPKVIDTSTDTTTYIYPPTPKLKYRRILMIPSAGKSFYQALPHPTFRAADISYPENILSGAIYLISDNEIKIEQE